MHKKQIADAQQSLKTLITHKTSDICTGWGEEHRAVLDVNIIEYVY